MRREVGLEEAARTNSRPGVSGHGEPGVVGGNRELHRSTYEKGMLDLRLQLTRMRLDYLNQINTQSTFIAGCAVGMLASGELLALDDHDGVGNMDDGGWEWWWVKAFNYVYTTSSSLCLFSSLWVIYTAANLITMSIHSNLYGTTMQAITEADQIIEMRMKEVRLMFIIQLFALACAAIAIISAFADTALMVSSITMFVLFTWHATKSDQGTLRLYERYTGLEMQDRWQHSEKTTCQVFMDLVMPFGYQTKTHRERLHSSADPVVSAIITRVQEGRFARAVKDGNAPEWGRVRSQLRHHGGVAGMVERLDQTDMTAEEKTVQRGILKGASRAMKQMEAGGALILQQKWRHRKEARGEGVFAGWLMKTASGDGPIEKLREAHAQGSLSKEATGDLETVDLRKLPAGTPRFSRWFVLHQKNATLSIYTKPDDYENGQQPKGHVANLAGYAVIRTKTIDGMVTLALLPISSYPSSPSPGAGAAPEGKSWYLRAETPVTTNEWCRRLRCAGAAQLTTELSQAQSAESMVSNGVAGMGSMLHHTLKRTPFLASSLVA